MLHRFNFANFSKSSYPVSEVPEPFEPEPPSDRPLEELAGAQALGVDLKEAVMAVQALRNRGQMIPEALLVHLSPFKSEHINLTGDYHWRRDGGLRNRKSRPLRTAFA
jgi:hypothetical protein